jgi:hypothetical protein
MQVTKSANISLVKPQKSLLVSGPAARKLFPNPPNTVAELVEARRPKSGRLKIALYSISAWYYLHL